MIQVDVNCRWESEKSIATSSTHTKANLFFRDNAFVFNPLYQTIIHFLEYIFVIRDNRREIIESIPLSPLSAASYLSQLIGEMCWKSGLFRSYLRCNCPTKIHQTSHKYYWSLTFALCLFYRTLLTFNHEKRRRHGSRLALNGGSTPTPGIWKATQHTWCNCWHKTLGTIQHTVACVDSFDERLIFTIWWEMKTFVYEWDWGWFSKIQ